jgi:hypothetical protein
VELFVVRLEAFRDEFTRRASTPEQSRQPMIRTAGRVLARLSGLAADSLRAATTAEQRSLATELLDLTAALDAEAMAWEINQSIRRALDVVGQINPYREAT